MLWIFNSAYEQQEVHYGERLTISEDKLKIMRINSANNTHKSAMKGQPKITQRVINLPEFTGNITE